MTTTTRVLITGAAGKTGSALVHALAQHPQLRARALVRRADARSESLRAAGAEVIVGSMDDVRDLQRAMDGVQRAYFVAPPSLNSLDHALNFATAAADAHLEHVVVLGQWLSSPSHPSLFTRRTWLTDRLMAWIPGVDFTLINVGWFADNYMPLLGMAAQLGDFVFPLGQGRTAPISNEDIGRVAAAVLADPARFAGQTLRPTGPRLLTPEDVAEAFARAVGRQVRYRPVSMPMFEKALSGLGLVPDVLRHQLSLYVQEYQQGAFASGGVTDVVPTLTGQPAEDLVTITQRYASREPRVRRGLRNKLWALGQLVRIGLGSTVDLQRWTRQFGLPEVLAPTPAWQAPAWLDTHGHDNAFGVQPDTPTSGSAPRLRLSS